MEESPTPDSPPQARSVPPRTGQRRRAAGVRLFARGLSEPGGLDGLTMGGLEQHMRTAAFHSIKESIVCADDPKGPVDLLAEYSVSQNTVKGYATLDEAHIAEIRQLQGQIERYSRDRSLNRPLNVLMHAEPGTGKSHFVSCLAASLAGTPASSVDFNMSEYTDGEDMLHALDATRDLKVCDKLPILFLDEFDSRIENYAILLPLLWDGQFRVRQRILKLGKVVIVLAGSKASVRHTVNALSTGAAIPSSRGKLRDLISRINGGALTIPSLDLVDGASDRDRRVDKVCIAIALIERRFNNMILRVPWALLKFVAETRFSFGVRSIEHLLSMLSAPGDDDLPEISPSRMPLPLASVNELKKSSLSYHLAEMSKAETVVERWHRYSQNKNMVEVREPPSIIRGRLSPSPPDREAEHK